MKLLIVSAYFESHRGGIEIVAGRLARELTRTGLAVSWFAADSTPVPHASDSCGELVPASFLNAVERWTGIPFPIPTTTTLRRLWRAVQAADAVMLHDSLYLANVAALVFARQARKPVLVVQHIGEVPYRSPLLRGVMRLANRLVARRMLAAADQVVFISEHTERYFAGVRFRTAPRVIFNGVDTSVFRPVAGAGEKAALRAAMGLPQHGPIALFVGRFVEKKGLHILERMARLSPELNWVFAGWGPINPDDWQLPNVRVMTDLAGPTLALLYHAGDVLVLPSTGEGFPLVVQEAVASGLPVVCGADSARADPEIAGLLYAVPVEGDPDVTAATFLGAARQAIAEDQPLLAAVRAAAAARRYDWAGAARAYTRLLGPIASREDGRSDPNAQLA